MLQRRFLSVFLLFALMLPGVALAQGTANGATAIQQPLIEPKLSESEENMEMDDTAMRGNGGGRGMNRQARLLAPSGNAEVFQVVGLLIGSPDFQRQ